MAVGDSSQHKEAGHTVWGEARAAEAGVHSVPAMLAVTTPLGLHLACTQEL